MDIVNRLLFVGIKEGVTVECEQYLRWDGDCYDNKVGIDEKEKKWETQLFVGMAGKVGWICFGCRNDLLKKKVVTMERKQYMCWDGDCNNNNVTKGRQGDKKGISFE